MLVGVEHVGRPKQSRPQLQAWWVQLVCDPFQRPPPPEREGRANQLMPTAGSYALLQASRGSRGNMTAMDVARSSHWWLSKFAARLLRLNPNASAPTAIRRAVANYDQAAHLDPEFAADRYYRKAVAAEAMRRSTRSRESVAEESAAC